MVVVNTVYQYTWIYLLHLHIYIYAVYFIDDSAAVDIYYDGNLFSVSFFNLYIYINYL